MTRLAISSVHPDDVADLSRLRRLERAENFPVALRVLPRELRHDLRAVYDVARFVDDVGDAPDVDRDARLRLLDRVRADLVAAYAGQLPEFAVVRRLQPVARRRTLPAELFLDLVEANRRDQTVARYPSYDDLLAYCTLSANPVGRLVLAVFGVHDREAERLSDDVCTALQVLEHCQDVVEDRRLRDRVYLPLEDLQRFGVTDTDLVAPDAAPALRRVVAHEVDRADALLRSGRPLVKRLRGWGRIAVAGYVAGGLATADALRRAGFDVAATTPRPRRRDVLRHAAQLLGRRA